MSSLQSPSYDESESSLSSSSEESSDYETDEEVVTLGGPKKPPIGNNSDLTAAQQLQARIAALLPQLQAANEELIDGAPGQSMEDVDDGEQHIEMNLGLGVLEEQREGDSDSSDDSSDSDEESLCEEEEGVPISSGAVSREPDEREPNIMRKLLGQKNDRRKPGIEDLG